MKNLFLLTLISLFTLSVNAQDTMTKPNKSKLSTVTVGYTTLGNVYNGVEFTVGLKNFMIDVSYGGQKYDDYNDKCIGFHLGYAIILNKNNPNSHWYIAPKAGFLTEEFHSGYYDETYSDVYFDIGADVYFTKGNFALKMGSSYYNLFNIGLGFSF